jgi:hypothetical protein
MDEITKAQGISWTKMGEQLVILDTRRERKFHEFDEVATFLWDALDKHNSLEALATSLTETYDVSKDQALNDVKEFLNDLKSKNLIS